MIYQFIKVCFIIYIKIHEITINNYNKDVEPKLLNINDSLNIFKSLSNIIGKKRIIWRYDPILFTDKYTPDYHINNFNYLIKELYQYTNKCIISFFDSYSFLTDRLSGLSVNMNQENILKISAFIGEIASKYNVKVETCAEHINLSKYGIFDAHCIDKNLIEDICGKEIFLKKIFLKENYVDVLNQLILENIILV